MPRSIESEQQQLAEQAAALRQSADALNKDGEPDFRKSPQYILQLINTAKDIEAREQQRKDENIQLFLSMSSSLMEKHSMLLKDHKSSSDTPLDDPKEIINKQLELLGQMQKMLTPNTNASVDNENEDKDEKQFMYSQFPESDSLITGNIERLENICKHTLKVWPDLSEKSKAALSIGISARIIGLGLVIASSISLIAVPPLAPVFLMAGSACLYAGDRLCKYGLESAPKSSKEISKKSSEFQEKSTALLSGLEGGKGSALIFADKGPSVTELQKKDKPPTSPKHRQE